MGRPKEFDRQEVLHRAVDTFWARGFEGTSVQMLVDSMGIHRASLYDTYGSKADLFKEAMDCYSSQAQEAFRQALDREGKSRDILRHFLRDSVHRLCTVQSHGCLMIKTVLSIADQVPGAHDRVVRHMEEIRGMVRDLLQRGKTSGEFAADLDVESVSQFLVTTYEGLVVSSAVLHDEGRHLTTVDLALKAVA
jgi:TetR/AcrR family transcriptional regulator, transcriptional repressor for nem operon